MMGLFEYDWCLTCFLLCYYTPPITCHDLYWSCVNVTCVEYNLIYRLTFAYYYCRRLTHVFIPRPASSYEHWQLHYSVDLLVVNREIYWMPTIWLVYFKLLTLIYCNNDDWWWPVMMMVDDAFYDNACIRVCDHLSVLYLHYFIGVFNVVRICISFSCWDHNCG